jgi:hypothetical protein
MKKANNISKFVKGLSALLCLILLSLYQVAKAGPTVHISQLVRMNEGEIDNLLKQDGSINITGVSSWFTSGGLDVVDVEKETIYEITDPKLTNFSHGQEITGEEFTEALEHYKNFGGFGYEESTGYAGFNGLSINLAGFRGLENKIIIDPSEDKIYYSTTILIPVLPGKDDFKMKTIAKDGSPFSFLEQGLQLEAGPNGKLELNAVKISLPDMELPAVSITGVVLEISKDSFAMEGEMGDFASAKAGGLGLSAAIEYSNGGLNKIAMEATGLGIPLATSGAYFQEIGGEIGNLTKPEAPWYFRGRALISYGKEPLSIFGNEVYLASGEGNIGFNQNGRVELKAKASVLSFDISTARFVYNPPSNFDVQIRDLPIGGLFLGDLDLTVYNSNVRGKIEARLGVPKGVPIIGGITLGGVEAGITYVKDDYFETRGEVYVVITKEIKSVCWSDCITLYWPHLHGCGWSGCSWHTHSSKNCWNVCTPRIPSIKASVGFSYHSKRSPAFKAWMAGVENTNYYSSRYPWEIPFVHWVKDPEAPGWWVFNQNWDILWAETKRGGINKQGPISKAGPEKVIDIVVPNELMTAVFRVNYEAENVEDLNVALVTPEGKILNLEDGPFPMGFTAQGVTGAASHNVDGREVFFMIHDVNPGTYKMVIDQPEKLGGIRAELASMTQKPEALGVIDNQAAKGGEILPGAYQIDWYAVDEDSPNAEISFLIDKNNTGNDGIHVGGGKLADFDIDEPFKFDTDQIPSVRPGFYYGVVAVDDGRNPVQFSYTEAPIWIDRDGAPKPVTTMRSRAGNNKVIVEWDEPEGDFSHYNVHVSSSDKFDVMDKSVLVEKGRKSAIVEGLENGQPYVISVVTADENYFESAMMEIHRVTPTQIPGATKPLIISNPIETATQGYNYVYIPLLFDADEHNPAIREIAKTDGGLGDVKTPIIWSIIEGPEGIKIDPAMGAVEWNPNPEQVGVHKVTIAATENIEEPEDVPGAVINNTTTQTFDISVAPKWNIAAVDDKVYFVTVPNLTAVAGTEYAYTPKISSNDDFEVELLSGPHGMEVVEGTLTWNVLDDSNGEYVHFRAINNSTGQELENRYFLHVSSTKNDLSVGAELVKVERVADKILLVWVGDADSFQIQSASSLTKDQAGKIDWSNTGDPIKGSYINYISLDDTGETSLFYRIMVLN